jgi:hypothetical protein
MKNYNEIQTSDYYAYYVNHKQELHRLDGPAIVVLNSLLNIFEIEASECWYLNGVPLMKIQHNRLVLFSILEKHRF